MAEECPKEKSNAVAFDLIYKQPVAKSPLPASPQGDRPLSREFIDQKLRDASERRENLFREQEEKHAKERLHREEVAEKAANDEKELKRRTKENLDRKLEASEERRENHFAELKNRLADHIKRIEIVRRKNEAYVVQLRERIEQKLEAKSEKRDQILANIKERLQEHDAHIEEVNKMLVAREKETADSTYESAMERMTNAFKNREKQINDLVNKLNEHDKHAEEVLRNKNKQTGAGDAPEPMES